MFRHPGEFFCHGTGSHGTVQDRVSHDMKNFKEGGTQKTRHKRLHDTVSHDMKIFKERKTQPTSVFFRIMKNFKKLKL